MNKLFKHAAFTLAEVLITLGIIGIVAAYTIPTLMRANQDAEYKAGFKKAYSEFNQILNRYDTETGGTFYMEDGSIDPDFWSYFKTEKICADATSDECWHSTYYTLNGGIVNGIPLGDTELIRNGAILANGTLIRIRLLPFTTSSIKVASTTNPISGCGDKFMLSSYGSTPFGTNYNVLVLFDVNGFKPPNRVGKDIYITNAIKGKLRIPLVSVSSGTPPYFETCQCYGASCAYAAITGN